MSTAINHDPPVINHDAIPVGTDVRISWAFGPLENPEDFTGRTAELILHPGRPWQERHPLDIGDAGRVIWTVPATFTRPSSYAVLIQDAPGGDLEVRVRGTLTPGVVVTP